MNCHNKKHEHYAWNYECRNCLNQRRKVAVEIAVCSKITLLERFVWLRVRLCVNSCVAVRARVCVFAGVHYDKACARMFMSMCACDYLCVYSYLYMYVCACAYMCVRTWASFRGCSGFKPSSYEFIVAINSLKCIKMRQKETLEI